MGKPPWGLPHGWETPPWGTPHGGIPHGNFRLGGALKYFFFFLELGRNILYFSLREQIFWQNGAKKWKLRADIYILVVVLLENPPRNDGKNALPSVFKHLSTEACIFASHMGGLPTKPLPKCRSRSGVSGFGSVFQKSWLPDPNIQIFVSQGQKQSFRAPPSFWSLPSRICALWLPQGSIQSLLLKQQLPGRYIGSLYRKATM